VARTIRLPPAFEHRARTFDALADQGFDQLRGIHVLDRTFYAASALGDHGLLWHMIGAVRALSGNRQMAEALRLSAVLGVESVLVNVGIKSLFRRTRPVHTTSRPFALRRPVTSSFPSGHATSAFCAAVLLSKAEPRFRPVWYAAIGWALGHIASRLVPLPDPPTPR